ncbi:hypothetical protein FHX42_003288 [Saccharopolyspora lacisalsi]|uniref:Uncharacterized protein n=1 Tax=Halosaccharopolyspora lacisalsi TaxID=1000566 RepID=A0A839DVB9_9PSEU|nr:hypothetical protein [Halosaccharopolyspora lacisalsi]MBA8825922.1 hypothetical protein [Halosaccharopolyspora lacisalsi]
MSWTRRRSRWPAWLATCSPRGSVQQTLDRIVQYAVEMVDGCEHAGAPTVYDWQRARTLAVTSDLARWSKRVSSGFPT